MQCRSNLLGSNCCLSKCTLSFSSLVSVLSSVGLSPISEIVCVELAAREMTLTASELVLRARQLPNLEPANCQGRVNFTASI